MPFFALSRSAQRLDALETRVRQLERDAVQDQVMMEDWATRMTRTLASLRVTASRVGKAQGLAEAVDASESDLDAILKHRSRNGR